ncbi:glycosyltransferase family 39 protein [Candidatus Oscillochloris fontis]|uniref:glycosyltransferase family 39 protein n=1 Tax=Candidatus Oscillochloris fontis TaxID=2496868 RepID=UPI00101D9DA7|nr:glycosyltransferase family 39 protein [Candidatus Oscillochloris fontis]
MREEHVRFATSGPIAGLLLIFIALAWIYNLSIPLGEGPDEPGHLAYGLFLVREHRLPVQRATQAESDVPGEGHQPPLAYLLTTPALMWLPAEQQHLALRANPDFIWAGGNQAAAFVHVPQTTWPEQAWAWRLARLASTLAGACTVLCTYLATRQIWPGERSTPLLAAACVAFNPQFLFIAALVSNDALLAALSAAVLWICLRVVRAAEPSRVTAFLLLGLLFGLALLTKQSALLLGPLLLWATWRNASFQMLTPRRQGAKPATKPLRLGALASMRSVLYAKCEQLHWWRMVRNSIAWAGTALLVAGGWYWRNQQLYGDPFAAALFRSHFASQPFAWGDPAAWSGGLSQLVGSFWARFGWMNIHPPDWALWFYWGVMGLGLLGWLLPSRKPASRLWAGPRILLGMSAVWVLSFVATTGLVAWQGRLLFPALAAVGIGLAGGMARTRVAWGVVAIMLGIAISMPYMVIGVGY